MCLQQTKQKNICTQAEKEQSTRHSRMSEKKIDSVTRVTSIVATCFANCKQYKNQFSQLLDMSSKRLFATLQQQHSCKTLLWKTLVGPLVGHVCGALGRFCGSPVEHFRATLTMVVGHFCGTLLQDTPPRNSVTHFCGTPFSCGHPCGTLFSPAVFHPRVARTHANTVFTDDVTQNRMTQRHWQHVVPNATMQLETPSLAHATFAPGLWDSRKHTFP